MKAIRIHETGGPEVLRLEEVETPEPLEGQVRIKVAAAGVNYADIAQRNGAYLTPTKLPTILGVEVAGMVDAHGPGVSSPPIGTRVAAMVARGYAEYVLTQPGGLIPLPDELDFVRAAALPVQGITAYQLVRDSAQLQPGESVLVHAAAGGVGTMAVQIAKLMGAGTVIGTAGSSAKLELARRLGADVVVNYREEDWVDQVRAATGNEGVDVILEMVGGDIAEQSLNLVTEFTGRMVIFGAAGGEPARISSAKLMQRNIAVIGYWLAPNLGRTDRIAQATNDLFKYLAAGQLEIIVGQTYPLAHVAEAHRALSDRSTTGKVVLTV
ncbi:MAG: NADPH:quinone oxidoreductase family protein [Chloroflexi bacterium]|nr:NADPH:quinone oxidoreductase family protein [Chloroflexota bacterium]